MKAQPGVSCLPNTIITGNEITKTHYLTKNMENLDKSGVNQNVLTLEESQENDVD